MHNRIWGVVRCSMYPAADSDDTTAARTVGQHCTGWRTTPSHSSTASAAASWFQFFPI